MARVVLLAIWTLNAEFISAMAVGKLNEVFLEQFFQELAVHVEFLLLSTTTVTPIGV